MWTRIHFLSLSSRHWHLTVKGWVWSQSMDFNDLGQITQPQCTQIQNMHVWVWGLNGYNRMVRIALAHSKCDTSIGYCWQTLNELIATQWFPNNYSNLFSLHFFPPHYPSLKVCAGETPHLVHCPCSQVSNSRDVGGWFTFDLINMWLTVPNPNYAPHFSFLTRVFHMQILSSCLFPLFSCIKNLFLFSSVPLHR